MGSDGFQSCIFKNPQYRKPFGWLFLRVVVYFGISGDCENQNTNIAIDWSVEWYGIGVFCIAQLLYACFDEFLVGRSETHVFHCLIVLICFDHIIGMIGAASDQHVLYVLFISIYGHPAIYQLVVECGEIPTNQQMAREHPWAAPRHLQYHWLVLSSIWCNLFVYPFLGWKNTKDWYFSWVQTKHE